MIAGELFDLHSSNLAALAQDTKTKNCFDLGWPWLIGVKVKYIEIILIDPKRVPIGKCNLVLPSYGLYKKQQVSAI